jgi:hypothetical protein
VSDSALGGILLASLGYRERGIVLPQWLQKVEMILFLSSAVFCTTIS